MPPRRRRDPLDRQVLGVPKTLPPLKPPDLSVAEAAVRVALVRAWPHLAEDRVHLEQLAIIAVRAAAPAVLMLASGEASAIAARARAKADAKAGEERKHWLATSTGASLAAVKLTEMAAGAESVLTARGGATDA